MTASGVFRNIRALFMGDMTPAQLINKTAVRSREALFSNAVVRRTIKKFFRAERLAIREKGPDSKVYDIHRYTAEYNGRVVGSISIAPYKKGAIDGYIISSAQVSPVYRGLGIGEALYRRVLADSSRRDLRLLYQIINVSNKRNRALAAKLGFKRLPEETEKTVVDKFDKYVFCIDLKESKHE